MKKLRYLILSFSFIFVLPLAASANTDPSGWQAVGTDSWYVDDYTQTSPKDVHGGGVRACFSGLAYSYAVTLFEYDNNNPDEQIGNAVTVTNGECVDWTVNTEDGHEEVYLRFTKGSTASDYVTVKWYD